MTHRRKHKKKKFGLFLTLLLLLVAGGFFCAWKVAGGQKETETVQSLAENHIRLVRSEIPTMPSVSRMSYSEMFPDMNDVQLEAAKSNGLRNPDKLVNPESSVELVKVETCEAYVVDSLRHSKPFLVPQAEKLLMYIGHRFDEIQTEYGIKRRVRPLVTSLLRSRSDVGRLRRVNRNATENSCHLYGTTFDISYTRFVDQNGIVVASNSKYKELLAKALYELRFEGLCFVRYERRQPCFHITVRSVDYEGDLVSEVVEYQTGSRPQTAGSAKSAPDTSPNNNYAKVNNSQTRPDAAKSDTNAPTVAASTPLVAKNKVTVCTRDKEFGHRGNYVFD